MGETNQAHELYDAVTGLLREASDQGVKVADLAVALELPGKEMYRLRRALTDLLGAGVIARVSRGHYALTRAAANRLADRDAAGKRVARPARAPDVQRPFEPATAEPVTTGPTVGSPAPDEHPAKNGRPAPKNGRPAPKNGHPAPDEELAPAVRPTPVPIPAPTPSAATRLTEPAPDPSRTGRISVHPAGYGFVAAEDDSRDIFVPAKYRGAALDGDRVELETWEGYKGTEGRVVRVLSRGRAKLTGTLRRAGRTIYVEPDDPRVASTYGHISLLDRAPGGKVGQAALVEISHYPTEDRPEVTGRLVRVLGDPDDPRTEIEKIIICADIPDGFPRAALAQAETTPRELRPEDFADRIDLRDRPFVTIDPENARDFDDALCVEDGPRGTTRVWIAVADVSHYVRAGDALDLEAVVRGVSVYLPDRVLPMLPFPLSAGICSLNPEVDRCAMVVRLDFTDDAQIVDQGFAAAVIRSHARLDYPGVAAALAGDFRGRRMHYRRWADNLTRLDTLARVLRARRLERGALELDIPEARVIIDDDDPRLVRNVVRAKGSEDVKSAYQLVEEFMIAANEAVGGYFRERDLTALWRVHAPPEAMRLDELAKILAAYGIPLDVEATRTPLGMKRALEALAGRPAGQALSFLILRSLTQAVYDTNPIGHFGLASPNYLHFTSPIRRYPDLVVHRLLKTQLHREGQASGGGAVAGHAPVADHLDEIARTVSQHERRAMEAEREAVSMYRAYLMRDQLGEHMTGTLSAVTQYGAFVELDEPFIEGLIKVDQIGDDAFVYDPVRMSLTGRRTGYCLRLGDRVLAEIANASVPLRRVDLRLLSSNGKSPPRGYADEGGKRRRRRSYD